LPWPPINRMCGMVVERIVGMTLKFGTCVNFCNDGSLIQYLERMEALTISIQEE
jgi:hypothetical protein